MLRTVIISGGSKISQGVSTPQFGAKSGFVQQCRGCAKIAKINYRSGTVNSKSFVGKVLLRIKWKFELAVYFKLGILGKL